MDKKDKYTFNDLVSIIAELRSEHGCPWDREQTHESLRVCMQEEAAEVMAAIRKQDMDNLCEELGDVLLQVLLHSEIAKEEGSFTLEDVIEGISKKMIRRHPHVFGNADAGNPDAVIMQWEEIKKLEKAEKKTEESEYRQIPAELPALLRCEKILKKADKLGEKGDNPQTALKEAHRLLDSLYEALEDKAAAAKIYGELLIKINSLTRGVKLHGEQALQDALEVYIEGLEAE